MKINIFEKLFQYFSIKYLSLSILLSESLSLLLKTNWLKFFFYVFNSTILIYIDLSIINLTTSTYFFWPILWTLYIAWSYTPGFHQGSIKNTLFAAIRFNPTPAVFNETKNIFTWGLFENSEIIFALYFWGVDPYIL